MILDALLHFKEVNDTFPEQLIIFRDSPTGSRLHLLKEKEVTQIESALKELSPATKLLFVVVCKKTNVELYA